MIEGASGRRAESEALGSQAPPALGGGSPPMDRTPTSPSLPIVSTPKSNLSGFPYIPCPICGSIHDFVLFHGRKIFACPSVDPPYPVALNVLCHGEAVE